MSIMFKTFLVAAVLAIAGTAIAHEQDRDHDRNRDRDRSGQHDRATMGLPAIEHLVRAFRHLDLDEGQKETIHVELKAMRETIHPLMKQTHESRRELHELITAVEYDEEAVSALATEQGNLTAEITMIVGSTASTVLAQLTDEQRSELEAMGEKRRAKREERREHGKEKPGQE